MYISMCIYIYTLQRCVSWELWHYAAPCEKASCELRVSWAVNASACISAHIVCAMSDAVGRWPSRTPFESLKIELRKGNLHIRANNMCYGHLYIRKYTLFLFIHLVVLIVLLGNSVTLYEKPYINYNFFIHIALWNHKSLFTFQSSRLIRAQERSMPSNQSRGALSRDHYRIKATNTHRANDHPPHNCRTSLSLLPSNTSFLLPPRG